VRLFVAVDLDDAARAAVAAEQDRLRRVAAGGSSLRWVRPEHLHITLLFLGEVAEQQVNTIIAAYAAPVPMQPFDLAFRGVGAFPPRGAPRALWIGVSRGEADLISLQRLMAERAGEQRIALETRPFSPHLTVGRWKDSRSSDRRRYQSDAANAEIAHVRIGRATLYRSQLSSGGPTYSQLAHATLAAPR
jgi:RNA 2',3'-cyclic 3'-phosphodiesterase